jgi:hypothetical protein
MSERLTDELLREIARFFTEQSVEAAAVNEALALRTRVRELEADIPLKWQARQDEMQATIDALRARVAKLEAALYDVLPYIRSIELKVATKMLLDNTRDSVT